jgi:hypothetical protein
MANCAPLPQRLVLVHERSALLCVTFKARFVLAQEGKPAGFERLLNVCRCAFNRDSFVHLVTIGTAHLPFEDRMVVRQSERGANFQVTLETGFGRFSRVDNCTSSTPGFDVQTPGPVAGLAAHINDLLWSFAALCAGLTHNDLFRLQSRMGGCSEIAHDLLVTGGAFF